VEVDVVNLVLPEWAFGGQQGVIELQDSSHTYSLSPIVEHKQIARQLMHSSQVAVTSVCKVVRRDFMPLKPLEAGEALGRLCPGISFATGNKVAWIAARTANARVHRSHVVKGYSPWIYALDWLLPIEGVVGALLNCSEVDYFAAMIDAFIDAVGAGPFLETRTLAAASVLDALTGHYAASCGLTYYVDQPIWEGLRPDLKAAIKTVCEAAGISEPLDSSVEGLRRRTFRQLLKKLLDDHSLPVDRISEVIKIRNAIVHDGMFPADLRDHGEAYKLMIWTTMTALARLLGYQGNLPEYITGS
jgi:hypothetical protein